MWKWLVDFFFLWKNSITWRYLTISPAWWRNNATLLEVLSVRRAGLELKEVLTICHEIGWDCEVFLDLRNYWSKISESYGICCKGCGIHLGILKSWYGFGKPWVFTENEWRCEFSSLIHKFWDHYNSSVWNFTDLWLTYYDFFVSTFFVIVFLKFINALKFNASSNFNRQFHAKCIHSMKNNVNSLYLTLSLLNYDNRKKCLWFYEV